jgi:hypothetical protein
VCDQQDAAHNSEFCSDECRQNTIKQTNQKIEKLKKFLEQISPT